MHFFLNNALGKARFLFLIISEPKTADKKGHGIKQGPDDHGRGEESSSSTPRPGDTREPNTAETKGQGIMQGPDDCVRREESFSSTPQTGDTR